MGHYAAPPVPIHRKILASIPRGDFFNIPNHPNFGNPTNYLTAYSPTPFGYASQMLNNCLGSGGQLGGLNPLYQIGGPRSIQLALRFQF